MLIEGPVHRGFNSTKEERKRKEEEKKGKAEEKKAL